MDNQQQPDQGTRKKRIIFVVSAALAVVFVGVVAYTTLSRIKSGQSSDAMTQEQFQTNPELSTALQMECQDSAKRISKNDDIDEAEQEFKTHVESCRETYFAVDEKGDYRSEGMYADLVVDIAHQYAKKDKSKAADILNFAKSLQPWEFYLGPVSCDSHHVIDAYLESLALEETKQCIKISEYKQKLIPEIEGKRYEILRTLLSNNDVVWMGQPESDVGCPEKISSVIQVMNKLTPGAISVSEANQEGAETTDVIVAIKTNGEEKLALIFRPTDGCLHFRSVLVQNLEVSE